MYCPKCGKKNPDGAKFCSGCGNPLAAASAIEPMKAKPTTTAAAGSSVSSLAAVGLTAHSRRIILSVLAAVILVIACFVPVFKSNADLLGTSKVSANVIGGLSTFSSSLGGSSFDTSGIRVDEAYSLFNLDNYIKTAKIYESEIHYGGRESVQWYCPFLLTGIAFCILCAVGIFRTITKGKCGVLIAFSCSAFLFYIFSSGILEANIPYYLPTLDGVVNFMLVLAVAEAVLSGYYMKRGLTKDAA